MQGTEFEKMVVEGFERLPQWVREKIKNVALLIEDEPPEAIRKRERLRKNETLLGYYQGIPLSTRGEHYGVGATMPDTITLYQEPIERAAQEESENLGFVNPNLGLRNPKYQEILRKIVTETIWHEFAHHFGIDERGVRERERRRRNSS